MAADFWLRFYFIDWLASTAEMSLAAQGAYVRLLCYQWDRGSIPADPTLRARLLGVTSSEETAVWEEISGKFSLITDGRLQNPRLERERENNLVYRTKQAQRAHMRWHPNGSSDGISTSTTDAGGSAVPVTFTSTSTKDKDGKDLVALRAPEGGSGIATASDWHLEQEPEVPSAKVKRLRSSEDRKVVMKAALTKGAKIVFVYWRERMRRDGTIFTPSRERKLTARLHENNGNISELLWAIDGALRDPWLMGTDPKSVKKYDGIDAIFRDRDQVERLIELSGGSGPHPFLADEP